jgi:hypothetical protein
MMTLTMLTHFLARTLPNQGQEVRRKPKHVITDYVDISHTLLLT